MPESDTQTTNYYSLLGLTPTVSVQEIRRAYRDLSKLYHPDTTQLPAAIATRKFQQLNEAYATLSNPQRRITYDQEIGYSRLSVMQASADLNIPVSEARRRRVSNAYLDPTDRPLSAGELFALFILGLTFIACLVLVVAIGVTKGDVAWRLPADFIINQTVQEKVEIDASRSPDVSIQQMGQEPREAETSLDSPASWEASSSFWKTSPPLSPDIPSAEEIAQETPSGMDQSTLSNHSSTGSWQTDDLNQVKTQIQD